MKLQLGKWVALLLVLLPFMVSIAGITYAENQADFTVTRGSFKVPLSHVLPDGQHLQISFVKIEQKNRASGTPHFFFSGGPGQSAIRLVENNVKRGKLLPELGVLIQNGPVYFVDQRGTGNSEPKLKCSIEKNFPEIAGGEFGDYLQRVKLIVEACRKNISGYRKYIGILDTIQTAHDFELFRKQIGADKIIIYGNSYGTHLALAYIRLFGVNVDRAILNHIEGPDHTFKLPKQFDLALSRIDDRRRLVGRPPIYPLLRSRFSEFVNGGVLINFTSRKNTREQIRVTKFELAMYVKNFTSMRRIDRLYRQLWNRDYIKLARYAQNLRRRWSFNAKYYATDCASNGSAARLTRIYSQYSNSLLGPALNFPFPYICDYLGVKNLMNGFRLPVKSGVPILAYSGALDFKTPVSNTLEVSTGFDVFTHVIDKTGFHSTCRKRQCIEILSLFLGAIRSRLKSSTIEID